MNRREVFKGLAVAGIGIPFVRPALAQAYPSKPIRILVPAPGGSPPDILARIVGNAISEAEGWTIVVENKPGGAMTIGALEALRQPADGYTLASVTAPIAAAQTLVPSAKLHVETDFAPVIQLGKTYNVLVVAQSSPAKTLPEFIAYLKRDPGKHTFSSGGFGTPAHLLGELFKLETGVQTLHVPYKGNSQAIADIINGTNTYQFITAVAVVDLIAAGKLKALVAMSQNRVPVLKEVPTIVESGYPKLASEDWAGILVKSGTPAPVIAQLNAAINKALKLDKVRAAFAKVGADTAGGTPEAFGKLVRDEVAHWSKVIKDANIKINP
ncbi:MAG: Bug family tripartite tricarboxylate transporter substrate binding protein [Xanthobacteraceae bacterium]